MEELKAILEKGGLEILAEGGPDELAGYLEQESGEEIAPVILIWLAGSGRALAEMRDRSILTVEGSPTQIKTDARLMDTLGKVVADGVKRYGFCVVDLSDFGLSVETAEAVAAVAGVEVSAGMKAVFAPAVPGDESPGSTPAEK